MTKTCAAVLALSACLAASARAQEAAPTQELSLSQAIALALAREPATRAARADVEIARGARIQAGLRSNATVSFEQRQQPGGHDTATEAAIEWPLDLFRRSARIAVADADVTVAEHEAADVRRQLAGDVAAAYGDVAAGARELAITDDVLTAATSQLDLLRARAAQGAAPTLDRDVVEVEVRRIQADRVRQQARMDMALLRLKRLLGLSPQAPLRATQTLEALVAAGEGLVGPSSPTTRPDVAASEARVASANARIAEARGEARAEVTVFGSYMRMDSGFSQRGFSTAGQLEPVRGQFNYLTAGAMVTLPLWNRQQGTIAAATAARQAAEARAEAARLTAAAEVSEAQVRYEQAGRAVTLYQDGVRPLARRNLDTVRETYQLGRGTVFEVLAEQRRYLETERAYTESLSEAYAAGVALSRARGETR
jgi:cobalt-zinc-cadmium efflux system outer membrane protein